MSKHAFSPDRREVVGDQSPPLGGGLPRTRGSGGGLKNSRAQRAPLPWYICKRCTKRVLSYKKTRGYHNKKCPPHDDADQIMDSVIDSLKIEPSTE
jgi:hypothetical protein